MDLIATLHPAPGARINAIAKPTIELASGRLITLDGAVTPNRAYFSSEPAARFDARPLPVSGTLRAGVCPAGLAVCQAVVIPARWPEAPAN